MNELRERTRFVFKGKLKCFKEKCLRVEGKRKRATQTAAASQAAVKSEEYNKKFFLYM
jgi:hypothetical protein